MEDRIARVISVLFHPVFLPLYLLLLLFNMDLYASLLLSWKGKLLLAGIVAFTTLIMPMIFTWVFYRMKLISSVRMISKEERIYPLLAQSVFFYLTYYLLKQAQVPMVFSFYMLGATFLAVCALVITFYYKISLHMMGMGGIFGFLLGLSMRFDLPIPATIAGLILISGIVGAARIKSDSHKISEVYSGFLVGTTGMLLLFLFL